MNSLSLLAVTASIVFATFTMTGCKSTRSQGSIATLQSSADCPCSDLQCWREKSDSASAKQFECAKSALDAAGTAATGGAKTVYDVTSGVIDVGLALNQNNQELLTIFSNLAKSGDIAGHAFGIEGKAVTECVKASSSTVNNVLEILKTALEFGGRGQDDRPTGTEAFNKIVSMWGSSMDATFKFSQSMLECIKLADKSIDNRTIVTFRKFMNGWTKVLGSIKTVLALVECGGKIYEGGKVLIGNTQCLIDDLAQLNASRKAVMKALAQEGTRQFNHAKYFGCTQCVNASYLDSTETEYKKCRACCQADAANHVPESSPKKRTAWMQNCQLVCGVARTEGMFRDYTDVAICNETKQMFPVSRHYRHIYLTDESKAADGERKRFAEEMRATVVGHAAIVRENFGKFRDAATSALGVGDMIQLNDFLAVADSTKYPQALREAAVFFGKSYPIREWNNVPYFFALMDTAQPQNPRDGKISVDDIGYFIDEIKEYADESEY